MKHTNGSYRNGTVAFIGLGVMGLPMLENLAHDPTLRIMAFDQSSAPFEAIFMHDAYGKRLTRAISLAELSPCNLIILMLPDSNVTNKVVLGDETGPGLENILRPGATIVDMGSSDPFETRILSERLNKVDIDFVDAPVSGGLSKAKSGELSIMVGASAKQYDGLLPILKLMGKNVVHVGKTGDAHAIKALNNYVYAAGLLAVSEALCIAEAMELNLDKFAEILNSSSGRNFTSETKLLHQMIPQKYQSGFLMRLQAKDLSVADKMRSAAKLDAGQLKYCLALWRQASEQLADADNLSIHDFVSRKKIQ